ncbi:hypothetical protein [Noviherbaspirillum soli]|uniref:hypothetical protein n=1 Tax=Noviherbaspirillum soli TaxID=1064518 RepID=UPI001889E1F5|nr:hypothetical protein [Noviherbaspirillum soli]
MQADIGSNSRQTVDAVMQSKLYFSDTTSIYSIIIISSFVEFFVLLMPPCQKPKKALEQGKYGIKKIN